MTFTIQHYADHGITLLDCPNPLDYERGLYAIEDEITTLLEQMPRLNLMIDIHNMGVFFDLFASQLKSHLTLFNSRVMLVLVGTPETLAQVESVLAREQIAIPTFETLASAFHFYQTTYTRAVGD